MHQAEKEKIKTIIDGMDVEELTYKINRIYMQPKSQRFIKLFPDPYPEMGICTRHIWEKMVNKILNEVKKEFHIKPERRTSR